MSILRVALWIKYGFSECTVRPLCLTSALDAFMNTMNEDFRDFLEHLICAYVDDTLVYSNTPEALVQFLRLDLDRVRSYILHVKLGKRQFAQEAANNLGLHIHAAGRFTEDTKVSANQAWITPTTKKDVQFILGMVDF